MQTSMPRLTPCVVALIPLALVWSALAQPAGSRSRIGSTEQAAEAIREFERNPALRLPEARPTPGGGDWRFVVPAGPEYWVSRNTGRAWRIRFHLARRPGRLPHEEGKSSRPRGRQSEERGRMWRPAKSGVRM